MPPSPVPLHFWLLVLALPIACTATLAAATVGLQWPDSTGQAMLVGQALLCAVACAARQRFPRALLHLWTVVGVLAVYASLRTAALDLPPTSLWRAAEWLIIPSAATLVVAAVPRTVSDPDRPTNASTWFEAWTLVVAIMLVACVLVTWLQGQLAYRSIFLAGWPNINVPVNTCAPFLAGSLAAFATGRRPSRWPLAIMVLGIASLLLLTIITGRRTVLALGLVTVGLVALAARKRPGFPPPRFWLPPMLFGAFGVIVLGAWWMSDAAVIGTGQRLRLYQVGLECIASGGLLGGGFHPAAWAQDLPSEWARHLTMGGMWGLHLHSEPLEIIATAGVLGAGALVAGVALLWSIVRSITDRPTRWACATTLCLLGLVALIDPSLSVLQGAWMTGIAVGFAIRASPEAVAPVRRWPGLVATGLAASVFAVGLHGLWPVALLRRDASPEAQRRCLEALQEREVGTLESERLARTLLGAGQAAEAGHMLEAAALRYGWNGYLPVLRAAAADAAGTPEEIRIAHERVLRRTPLNLRSASALTQLDKRDAAEYARIDPEVLRGALLAMSDPRITAATPPLPVADISSGMLALETVLWHWQRTGWSPALDQTLAAVVARYGDIPDVAALTAQLCLLEPRIGPWLEQDAALLRVGFRSRDGVAQALAHVTNAAAASVAQRMVLVLTPELNPAWATAAAGSYEAEAWRVVQLAAANQPPAGLQ